MSATISSTGGLLKKKLFALPDRPFVLGTFFLLLAFGAASTTRNFAQTSPAPFPGPEPPRIARDLSNRTGDFANQDETDVFILFERSGHLILRDSAGSEHPVNPLQFVKKGEQTSFTYASKDL